MLCCVLFSFSSTATSYIYTLSLHDALPIFALRSHQKAIAAIQNGNLKDGVVPITVEEKFLKDGKLATRSYVVDTDRKSTRLNSSHVKISYAVFCLKKKIKN